MKKFKKIYDIVFRRAMGIIALNFITAYFATFIVCDINQNFKVSGYELTQSPSMSMWMYVSVCLLAFGLLMFIGQIFLNYRKL